MGNDSWFPNARYGLFIHYGLYSLLGRGEWVWNREQIPLADYRALVGQFTATQFDAEAVADFAVRCGMRYVVFTTMHHEGFRLYETGLSDFRSSRDLTGELVAACRKRGLRIGLYHSLNNWMDQPDAVAALEDKAAYDVFIRHTFARVRELVTRYNPIDVLWYDGWWPFNAAGWRGDGSIPEPAVKILETVGRWLQTHGECIFGTDRFTFDLREKGDHRGDWSHQGPFTVRGHNLYWLVRRWCGTELTLGGLECQVRAATVLSTGQPVTFRQTAGRVQLTGLPDQPPDALCPVIRLECDRPPALYLTGGLRVPRVPHPHYDPCPSDIQH